MLPFNVGTFTAAMGISPFAGNQLQESYWWNPAQLEPCYYDQIHIAAQRHDTTRIKTSLF